MGYITALTFVFLNFDELWKMNRTLFDCGLRKSVELKDGRVYVITSTLEKTVKLSSATVKCKHCDRSFKVEQYLDSHVQFKHPASATQNSNSISSASRDTLTIFVNNNNHSGETNMHRMAESQQLEDVPRESAGVAQGQTQRRSNNRGGSNKRKSYTIVFTKKSARSFGFTEIIKKSVQHSCKTTRSHQIAGIKVEKKQKQNSCRTDHEQDEEEHR